MGISIDRTFLGQVDLCSLIEQKTPIRFGKASGNGSKRTRKGACPFCGGTDRFAVFVNESPGRYYCGIHGNGCGAHGDAIDFLRRIDNLTFTEAYSALMGLDLPQEREFPQATSSLDWRSEKWQRKVAEFCKVAEQRLWTDEGVPMQIYLSGRGLTETTIKKAHLGMIVRSSIPYLVIPWYDEQHERYWRVNLRDIRPDIKPSERYKNLEGSNVRDGIYGAISLIYNRPTFLVEGEIDALSVIQEAADLVSVVATGGTRGSHALEWVIKLANMPHVFVAFDAEKKGEEAALYWLNALDNATRWHTPIGKDANEMLQRGLSIRMWCLSAIDSLPSPFEDEFIELPTLCSTCGSADLWQFNEDGSAVWCLPCWEDRQAQGEQHPSMTADEFIAFVKSLVEPVFGTCTVQVFPAGSAPRLADRVAQEREQEQEQIRATRLAAEERKRARVLAK